jgi:autotransporter-associated beta strand protein
VSNNIFAGIDTWNSGATTTWNTAGNWTPGSANKPPISGDSLVFAATTGTTTLTDNLMTPGTFNVAGITFNAGAASYTINPNTAGTNGFTLTANITNNGTNLETINDSITLSAVSVTNIAMTAGGGDITLGGPLASTGGELNLTGTGTLTLSGNNTFVGETEVNGAVNITTSVVVNANETLVLGSNTANGTGAIGLRGGTLQAASGGVTFSGNGGAAASGGNVALWDYNSSGSGIGGSNPITSTGVILFGGSQTLTVNNSATTTFGGINLRPTSGSRFVTINGSGNLVINGATFVISGGTTTSALTYAGTGMLTLMGGALPAGESYYTGNTSVNSGIINIQGATALGTTGNATANVIVASGGALQMQGGFTTAAAVALTLSGTGVTSNPRGALENVSGNNTYTGLVDLGAAATIGSDAGMLTLSNTGNIAGGGFGLTLTGAGNGSLAGSIHTIAGTLTKSGNGTWTLSGANTYTGTTTVSNGTLQFAKASSLYNGTTASWTAANITVASGATAAFNVGGAGEFTSANIDTLKGLGTTTSNGFANGSSLGFDTTNASGGNFAYSSNIANPNGGANALGIVKLGANTLTLSGTNTYTGATTINGGSLKVAANGALGSTSAVAINSGGSLVFGSSSITTGLNTAATVTMAGGSSLVMNGASQTIGTLTLLAGISTIDLTGGGLLTLSNIGSWASGAVLDVINWQGPSTYTGDSTHQINLGSGALAFFAANPGDLAQINWIPASTDSGVTFGNITGAQLVGSQLTPAPVPEPTTVFVSLCLVGLLGWRSRRQLMQVGYAIARKSTVV